MLIPTFLIAMGLVYLFPKKQKYLVIAPILGALSGSILWFMTIFFTQNALREDVFFAFLSLGVIISECILHYVDLDFDQNN